MHRQGPRRDRNGAGLRWTCAVALALLALGTWWGVPLAVRAGEAFGFVSVLAALWLLPGLSGFRASRSLAPDLVHIGQSARMRTEVYARHLPWFHVAFADRLPPGGDVQGLVPTVPLLVPGIPHRAECHVRCARRGVHPLDEITITGGDLFGLVRRTQTVRVEGALTVAPRVFGLREVGIEPRRLYGELRVRRGLEDELAPGGVRAYAPGDPFRLIHWRQTARTGALQVRELDRAAGLRAFCVIDLGGEHRVFSGDEPLVETVLSAAASLVAQFVRDGVEVGLHARDATRAHTVPIQARARSLRAIMTAMATMRGDGSVRFRDVLRAALATLPRDAVPVIFCSSIDPDLAGVAALMGETGRRPLWVQVVRGPYPQALKAMVGGLADRGVHCHHVFGREGGRWVWEGPRVAPARAVRHG